MLNTESTKCIPADNSLSTFIASKAIATTATGIKRLLFVDDDPAFIDAAQQALSPHIDTVIYVQTIAEALDELYRHGEELIVATDLVISRSDQRGILGGLELLEKTRSFQHPIPVLLFSDYHNIEAQHRAATLGVSRILEKPKSTASSEGVDASSLAIFFNNLRRMLAPYFDIATPQAQIQRNDFVLGQELAEDLDAFLATQTHRLPPKLNRSALHPTSDAWVALRSMLTELLDEQNDESIALLVLRFAAEFVERAALFRVTEKHYRGIGGFSPTIPSQKFVRAVREIQLEREQHSIFDQVTEYASTIRTSLEKTLANLQLLDALGGPRHSYEVIAIPLVTSHQLVGILYADNPSGKLIQDATALDIFVQQAGTALERSQLETQLHMRRAPKLS
ncbi:MAG: response regulator [Myxococcota bacterium]